jgi:hypothetical protein
MEEHEDLGAKFGRDKTFCFDNISIHEIIFDDTNDLTLYCTVPYFGETYYANFGLSFDQLNTLLRNHKPAEPPIAAALAEKLNGDIEIPSVIEVETLYGKPLEINNCILYTSLFDVSSDDDDDYDEETGERIGGDDDDDDDGYEAFAFIVDEIKIKPVKPDTLPEGPVKTE